MLNRFAFLLLFAILSVSQAKSYKIGSRIFVSQKEVDKLYLNLNQKISKQEAERKIVSARKMILVLKTAHQIPEKFTIRGLSGYELDSATLLEYFTKLKAAIHIKPDEIQAMQAFLAQSKNKKSYILREIVAKPEILAQCAKLIAASENKSSQFQELAFKHSASLSAQYGGYIGNYNPNYDLTTAKLFENVKKYDVIHVGNALYFVEDVVILEPLSDKSLEDNIVFEKIQDHMNILQYHYPVEVVEIK